MRKGVDINLNEHGWTW